MSVSQNALVKQLDKKDETQEQQAGARQRALMRFRRRGDTIPRPLSESSPNLLATDTIRIPPIDLTQFKIPRFAIPKNLSATVWVYQAEPHVPFSYWQNSAITPSGRIDFDMSAWPERGFGWHPRLVGRKPDGLYQQKSSYKTLRPQPLQIEAAKEDDASQFSIDSLAVEHFLANAEVALSLELSPRGQGRIEGVVQTLNYQGHRLRVELDAISNSMTIQKIDGMYLKPAKVLILSQQQLKRFWPEEQGSKRVSFEVFADAENKPSTNINRPPTPMPKEAGLPKSASGVRDFAQSAERYSLKATQANDAVLVKLYTEAARINARAQHSGIWGIYARFFKQAGSCSFAKKARTLNKAIEKLETSSAGGELTSSVVQQQLTDKQSALSQALHLSTVRTVEQTSSELALQSAVESTSQITL